MFRNVIISVFATIMIFLVCSGCTPVPERLYAGKPLSNEQISLINDGSVEFAPLEGHGWFRQMKIDGSDKCTSLSDLNKPCEVLPGQHALEVTYKWWTKANYDALVASDVIGGAFCGIFFPMCIASIAMLPASDMTCQGGLEFSTEGGRNYIIKIAATGNDVASLMQNTSLVIEDTESKQLAASTLMYCTEGQPRKEETDENKTGNPLTP